MQKKLPNTVEEKPLAENDEQKTELDKIRKNFTKKN